MATSKDSCDTITLSADPALSEVTRIQIHVGGNVIFSASMQELRKRAVNGVVTLNLRAGVPGRTMHPRYSGKVDE